MDEISIVRLLKTYELELAQYTGARIHHVKNLLGKIRINQILIEEEGLTHKRINMANRAIHDCKTFLGF